VFYQNHDGAAIAGVITATRDHVTALVPARDRVIPLPRIVGVARDPVPGEWLLQGRDHVRDPWVRLARLPGCNFDRAWLLWLYHRMARAILVDRDARYLGPTRDVLEELWEAVDDTMSWRHQPLTVVENATPEVEEFVSYAFDDARLMLDMPSAVLWDVLHGRGLP
jgi:hypothetical protein